ncbi:2OG-Fe(II) oxygenase [Arcobacter arenosus]|uniref:2OG-Fe(II) oxygenase n=1 Tax=Arcobacter arenosus TaxID=2576037 RepID=A0A5R8Y4B7_9BACT|nr:2OG-Fe(II) oxygenase [Arcobacter arenosus]TLP40630.1 2OG-Fe(II) oxygenase [Arcobacter arenosus]
MKLEQISNFVFCDNRLNEFELEFGLLPNPYYDYPFLIIKDFLAESLCDDIIKNIKKEDDYIDAKIKKENYLNETDKSIRKTKIYKLSNEYKNIYKKRFLECQKLIEDFFSMALTTSTKVQVLEYQKGSFYKAHSDDSNMILKDDELVGFKNVALNRKITTVLFASSCKDNDDFNTFSGGELVFNFLYDEKGNNIKYIPKAGEMIVFLSNPYFTHEVLEVKSGYRLSLVQWHDALIN